MRAPYPRYRSSSLSSSSSLPAPVPGRDISRARPRDLDGGIPTGIPLHEKLPHLLAEDGKEREQEQEQEGEEQESPLRALIRQQALRATASEPRELTDYLGPTVGVEQELVGPKVHIFRPLDRGVLGEVRAAGQVVLQFTSDMGEHPLYTIELKTTACEISNDDALRARRMATELVIEAILAAGKEGSAVQGMVRDQLELKIIQPGHQIVIDHGYSLNNQVSLGVRTDHLVSNEPECALINAADWIEPSRADELPPEGLRDPERARRVYAMLASVIGFLAGKLHEAPELAGGNDDITQNIYDPRVKDSWGVLPRTPPWAWLDALDPEDAAAVRHVLLAESEKDPSCRAAHKHISARGDLAGHPIPVCTIEGMPSSVFEFRKVPLPLEAYLYEGARDDRAGCREDLNQDLLSLKDLAILKRRALLSAPSDLESDSEPDSEFEED